MRRLIEIFIKLKLSIFKRLEIDPFQASESDITDMYDPDQLLDYDEEGYEDEDVEISILFQRKSHSFETWLIPFGFRLNKLRSRISAALD